VLELHDGLARDDAEAGAFAKLRDEFFGNSVCKDSRSGSPERFASGRTAMDCTRGERVKRWGRMLRELRVKKIAANEESRRMAASVARKDLFRTKERAGSGAGGQNGMLSAEEPRCRCEGHGQFPGGLIALRGILFETLGDNTFEFEGEVWIELARRNGKAMEYGVE